MRRQTTEIEPTAPAQPPTGPPGGRPGQPAARDVAADIRRYGEDLEARYIAARNAWTLAMRVASSGRPADLASLAIAQEAYEAIADERERWLSAERHAIPVEPESKGHSIEVAVGQELAWRRVLEQKPPPRGFFGRIKRRLGGR
jgi:hypothetical protein